MQSRRTGQTIKHVALAYVTNYPTRYGWRPQGHDRPDFFPGAVARAQDFGYKLEHFWLGEPGMGPERFCRMLGARGIHGLIVGRLPPGQLSLELAWEQFSCVALGMTLRSPLLHRVTENHFNTAWEGMERCLTRGYRRVGFVFSEANDSPSVGDRWLGAYLGQQLRLPLADRLPPCPAIPADEATFSTWFRRYRPDALLVNHARGVLDWLNHLGCQVPRDVGVIELEDRPELGNAGVHYDPANIGALAVEMVIGLMQRNETGVPANPHEVLLNGEWREGRTLVPPPAAPQSLRCRCLFPARVHLAGADTCPQALSFSSMTCLCRLSVVAALAGASAALIGAPQLPTIPAAVFSIATFGAVGDGRTDNTTAIQTAINTAQTAGGGTVEGPRGRGFLPVRSDHNHGQYQFTGGRRCPPASPPLWQRHERSGNLPPVRDRLCQHDQHQRQQCRNQRLRHDRRPGRAVVGGLQRQQCASRTGRI